MAALFFWAVLGGLVGGFVKSVAWYESSRGWLPCVLFGITGGLAGGFLRTLAGPSNGFDWSSMGLSALGAAAMLTIYNLFVRRRLKSEIVSPERRAA